MAGDGDLRGVDYALHFSKETGGCSVMFGDFGGAQITLYRKWTYGQ